MIQSCDGCQNGFSEELLTMPYPEGDQLCYCTSCLNDSPRDQGIPECLVEYAKSKWPRKGSFTMKGYTSELINTYYCNYCEDKEHEVVEISGPPTTKYSQSTMRMCTRCKRQDGPWISSDLIMGY